MTDRFGVQLGTAHAGWLPVEIVIGDHRCALQASGVMNDPLEELADAALDASREGAVDVTVHFWQEPRTTVLRIVGAPSSSLLRVELGELDDWPPFARGPCRWLHAADVARDVVVSALIDALRLYRASLPRSGVAAGWGSFPSAKLFTLTGATDGERVFLPPWREVRGLSRFVDELRTEVGPRHPLSGVLVSVVARRVDDDDVLFQLHSGPDPFAVVRLTWSGSRERGPAWPSTELFSSFRDFVERRMAPDSIAFRAQEP